MKERIRTYAWEFPIRLTHWVNFLCVLALSATGFYIGAPFVEAQGEGRYVMGWMRAVHFTTAYAFLMSFIVRLYWAFMGNKYASWRVFLPLTARQRSDLKEAAKFYLLISRKPPYAVGHTATAGVYYLIIFLFFLFEIVSGFALYSESHHGALWTFLGGWLLSVMHVQSIRLYHHLAMYAILALAAAHIYIAWLLDGKEKNGLMGSIFGGYKFVTGKEWE